AAGGAAATLVGRALAPDDFLTARAALSGRIELRPGALAVPLRRGEGAVGAIGGRLEPPEAGLRAGDLARGLCAARGGGGGGGAAGGARAGAEPIPARAAFAVAPAEEPAR